MTAIKIPLSVDQRASECLEEYGFYHRLPDLRLNDRCLIGYMLKTIRGMLPTAEVLVQPLTEGTAEDLEVSVTPYPNSKWYWKVDLQASVEAGCRYYIEVMATECDAFAIIGTVDRLTTLLAILSSGVDFSFVPNGGEVGDTIMFVQAGAGIVKGLDVWRVQEAATETYNKVSGTEGLRKYIGDLRQVIGGGGNPELTFCALTTERKLTFYISLHMYDNCKDRPWDTSLGTADNIIAALIITCGGVEYTGEIAPTFPQGDGLDVQTLEEALSEAYPPALYGNCLPICDCIADTFRSMGYGVVVNHGLDYHVMVREAGSKTARYKITPVNNNYGVLSFDVHYNPSDSTLYLGRVSSVIAVIAIVCTSLSFKGEEL